MRKGPNTKKEKEKKSEYKLTKDEIKIRKERRARFKIMLDKKKKLGINDKCARMDALFTPSLIDIEDPNLSESKFNETFSGDDAIFSGEGRKSKPMAFEKITTAVALLVKENPRVLVKAFNKASQELNLLQENVYYENFATMRKIRVLRKYVYHLSKYGLGYWREYIKQTYKKEHDTDAKGVVTTKWVYDVYDEVAENIDPRNIVIDDGCISIKDVNKPANDLFLFEFLSKEDFEYKYPTKKYEKAKYVKEGQQWLIDPELEKVEADIDEGKKKIMVLVYENKGEGLKETWVNQIPMESVPLPGGDLSVQGEKWVENLDDYDGIGIGQILEIYQPIVDDIITSSLERLRQIVRPNEDHFNGVTNADEADDVSYGSGSQRKWTGSPKDIVYNSPPARSANEQAEEADLDEEIDRATMIPRNLAGTDDAKTAYQSAQNRESALNKLSIPLDAIKYTLEDACNLSLKLFAILYSVPLETKILSPGDDEFDEAMAIIKLEPTGERAVIMKNDEKTGEPSKVARRRFREMELPIAKEQDEENNSPTGRMVESDEKKFWELIPKTFNWRGRFEIIAESFLPVSKALEDEQIKETIDFLMQIPTTDEMGNPVLKDANGMPYTIDRVKLAKERAKIGRHFDSDKIIVPLKKEAQVAGDTGNPLKGEDKISLGEATGNKRPEVNANSAIKK